MKDRGSAATRLPMKAVLFDLDGTLLDTLSDIAASVNQVRAELALRPHPTEAYRRFVGDGADRLVARAFPPSALRGTGLLARRRRYEKIYGERCLERTRPYPGITRMLDGLAKRGLPMAVVSNKPQRFVERCVAEFFTRWRFTAVRGARPGTPLKPDPAGPLAAARSLGTAPGQIAYLGDTGVDMRSARSAGMLPVGVLWGFRGAAELKRCGARALIRRPAELLALLAI